jgi:hypothetical protein
MKYRRLSSILAMVSILVAISGIQPARAATVVTLTLEPKVIPIPSGTFTVDVLVDADVPIRGIQFDLDYNHNIITLNSVSINPNLWLGATPVMTCTGATPSAVFNFAGTIDNSTGFLDAFGTSPLGVPAGNGCTGSGIVATLTFTAVAEGLSLNTFPDVRIPAATGGFLPPSGTSEDGYETFGNSVRIGPDAELGIYLPMLIKMTVSP